MSRARAAAAPSLGREEETPPWETTEAPLDLSHQRDPEPIELDAVPSPGQDEEMPPWETTEVPLVLDGEAATPIELAPAPSVGQEEEVPQDLAQGDPEPIEPDPTPVERAVATALVPTTKLRDRQKAAFDAVFNRLAAGANSQVVALPTGVGKTVLGSHVAGKFDRVLFLVHREELMKQAARSLSRSFPGASVGFIKPGHHHDTNSRFTVGMIGTLNRRLDKIQKDAFDCVIVDEAHHAAARTWRDTLEHFDARLRLGLTATPERADGRPLNDLFGEVSYEMTIKEAVQESLLVWPKAMRVKTNTSLNGVNKLAGDFNEKQLAGAINTPERNNAIVSAYLKVSPEHRKGLAFTAGIEHAKDLAATFRQAGVAAEWISGDDPDRAQKIRDHEAGKIRLLCNAMLLTEGYDDPSIGIVLMARPTMSRSLYTQCIGRGLRLDEANKKEDCLILDFVDDSKRQNIMDAWNTLGVEGKNKAFNKPVDVFRQHKARAEMVVDRWEDIYDTKLDFKAVEVLLESVKLFAPPARKYVNGTHPWMLLPPTPKQIATIEDAGGDCDGWTRGQAAQAIDALPPTKKQAVLLLALGFNILEREWTRGQADKAISAAQERKINPDWSRVNALGLGRAPGSPSTPSSASHRAQAPAAQDLSQMWQEARILSKRAGTPASEKSLGYLRFLESKAKQHGLPINPFAELVTASRLERRAPSFHLVRRAIDTYTTGLQAKGISWRPAGQ